MPLYTTNDCNAPYLTWQEKVKCRRDGQVTISRAYDPTTVPSGGCMSEYQAVVASRNPARMHQLAGQMKGLAADLQRRLGSHGPPRTPTRPKLGLYRR